MSPRIHIGTSGWHYPHWRGPFYPADLPPSQWFAHYATLFDTVELNNTFYRLPTVDTARGWAAAAPGPFRFALKGSRFITHMKHLRDPEPALARFLPVAQAFGRKLGPVLFQLPGRWKVDVERLGAFLDAVPRGLRCTFELRDESWFDDRVLELLHAHRAAFCIYEIARVRSPVLVTTDFAYVRLHGPGGNKYQGRYSHEELAAWVRQVERWDRLKDVWIYFDNDDSAFAALNALELKAMLRGTRPGVPRDEAGATV